MPCRFIEDIASSLGALSIQSRRLRSSSREMKFCQRTVYLSSIEQHHFVLFYVLSLYTLLSRSICCSIIVFFFFFFFIGNTEFVETRIVHALDVYIYIYTHARARVFTHQSRVLRSASPTRYIYDSIYRRRWPLRRTSARKSPSTQGARELLCAMFKLVRGWRSSTATPEGMKACASNRQLLLRREKWGRVLRTVHPF